MKRTTIVKLAQSHEEYKRASVLEGNSLASFIYEHPQLRKERIMQESMSPADFVEYLKYLGNFY
jgi:hypothetical protein